MIMRVVLGNGRHLPNRRVECEPPIVQSSNVNTTRLLLVATSAPAHVGLGGTWRNKAILGSDKNPNASKATTIDQILWPSGPWMMPWSGGRGSDNFFGVELGAHTRTKEILRLLPELLLARGITHRHRSARIG